MIIASTGPRGTDTCSAPAASGRSSPWLKKKMSASLVMAKFCVRHRVEADLGRDRHRLTGLLLQLTLHQRQDHGKRLGPFAEQVVDGDRLANPWSQVNDL